MAPRVRKPKATPAEAPQEEFNPMAVAGQDDADDNLNAPEEGNVPRFLRQDQPEDSDGDILETEQVFDPDGDEDPTTGPLAKTEEGRTKGEQAALAEVNEYLRRKSALLSEIDDIKEDIKELDKEFKNKGYDMPAMQLITKLSRMTEAQRKKRIEQNGINATYAHAAGIDEELL